MKILLLRFKSYIECPCYNPLTDICHYGEEDVECRCYGEGTLDLCVIDQEKENETIKKYLGDMNESM